MEFSTSLPEIADDFALDDPGTFLSPGHVNASIDLSGPELASKRDSLSTVIPMTLVYAIILVTGVTGNVCTCVVISRNKYMHTATNYYLFSLAVSDLTLLVLGLPQELYQLWERYPYGFGEAFCIFRGLTSETSTNASILTITSFTMERYLAICHPLKAHTMSKLSRAVKLIVCVWVCSSLSAVPMALQLGIVYEEHNGVILQETAACSLKRPLAHAFEMSTLFFFILPITLISVLYVFIGVQLRQTSAVSRRYPASDSTSTSSTSSSPFGSRDKKKNRERQNTSSNSSMASRRAVVKMLVAVVVAFFLCWAPFHAQRLLAIYVTNPTPTDVMVYTVLTYISGVTYYVSATINPILYSIMSLKFRQAFKDTLAHCCTRRASRPARFTYTSHPNSTIRSTGGYDGTDLSVVSDSPRHVDLVGSKRRHENGKLLLVTKRDEETDLSLPTRATVHQNGHSDSPKGGCHPTHVSSTVEGAEISDYILKIKNCNR